MDNRYEAAELVVVGNAKDTILGMKDLPTFDTRTGEMWREEAQMFEE